MILTRSPRLDVAQHMSLCRHYVRELRRSVLVATPDMERGASKRSSTILDNLGDLEPRPSGPSMYASEKERDQDAQMSAFLREEQMERETTPNYDDSLRRPSPSTAARDATDSSSPAHTVSRLDIRASAEKILYTFLLPGAEREIVLPGSITQDVIAAIEEHGRDDPEVFDTAKDYVFQAMERDAFPGFLRMKALGNLIPPTLVMRLIIGLVAMFGAFWTSFVLIFLNRSRAERCWVRPRLQLFSSTCVNSNFYAGHSAILSRRLLPRLVPVLTGSHHGPLWLQRIYAVQLFPHPRALRPHPADQARLHRATRDGARHRRPVRPIHLGTGQTPVRPTVATTSNLPKHNST